MLAGTVSYLKKYGKKIIFCILKVIKVTDERSRIWSWNPDPVGKCHGSPSLCPGSE
jgi:hypothetical protein